MKSLIAMPYVLDSKEGKVIISAHGVDSIISFRADHIRQRPVIDLDTQESLVQKGTQVKMVWPDLARSISGAQSLRFVQIAEAYTWLNPHLTLILNWDGVIRRTPSTDREWTKWKASDPTCPHWYNLETLSRLIAAYLSHDADNGRERSEFRGLIAQRQAKGRLTNHWPDPAALILLCPKWQR